MSRASTATSSRGQWDTSRARPTRSSSWPSGRSVKPTRSLRPPAPSWPVPAGTAIRTRRPRSCRTPSTRRSPISTAPSATAASCMAPSRSARRSRRPRPTRRSATTCHTGDIAPILFAPIAPAGREHPGAPKLDVNVWRNIHWRMANGPAVIDGVPYDKIERADLPRLPPRPHPGACLQRLPLRPCARVPGLGGGSARQRHTDGDLLRPRGAPAADGVPQSDARRRLCSALGG